MMDSFENVTVEAVRDFILNKGGKVTNHELVKHFKAYLTHPENRVQARNNFKEIVNIVATIIRSDDGEKYLVLKKKFRAPSVGSCSSVDGMLSSPATSPEPLGSAISIHSLPSLYPTPAIGHRFSASQDSLNHYVGPPRHLEPPPYRPPPPPVKTPPNVPLYASIEETMSLSSSQSSNSITKHSSMEDNFFPMNDSNCPPPVPPRRRSSCDKIQPIKTDNKENSPAKDFNKRPRTIGSENEMPGVAMEPENRKISVKECTQKFNRMASESNVNKLFNLPTASTISNALKKRHEKVGDHEDDAVSVSSVGSDPKAREWMIRSARSDYQTLAKLAAENPRLARFKGTALHWAAKHGNEDVIKLIAGTYGGDVNVKSNGGYTPLHIAMQFGHEDIFNLLVQVYGADSNIRDYSGRKPRQYQTNQDTSVSADTFRKIKARKKQSEKDLGFLRIGSLNVRVKKTTEALGNFLGKSQSSVEKLHKSWGSADNIQQEYKVMPPPKFAPIKKRKSKRAQDFVSQSTPSTPDLRGLVHSKPKSAENMQDSDSDTACGFGSQWQP